MPTAMVLAYPHILFDLDGTLSDPREGILACIRHALVGLGVTPPDDARLRRCIGPPLLQSFQELLGERAPEAPQALALYRDRFKPIGMFENQVYPGIVELLAALTRAGATLHLCTSKPRVYAGPILEHFALREHFGGVYGSELDGTRTDKVQLLAYLLQREGLDPSRSVLIGDRRHDVLAARAHGVTAIGVRWGFAEPDELEQAGAHLVLDTVRQLKMQLLPQA